MSIHDQARKFLSTDGLKLSDPQKKAVFEFADWLAKQPAATYTCPHCRRTMDAALAVIHASDCIGDLR